MKKDEVLAVASRTFSCPTIGKGFTIRIEAQAYFCGGNSHPHFSVTGEVLNPRRPDDCEMCGCLHGEAAEYWPAITPIIALHLSNADNGEPMYAEANGFYWLAGSLPECGNMGERYHGGNSSPQRSSEECLKIMQELLRITPEMAQDVQRLILAKFDGVIAAGRDKTSEFTHEQLQRHAGKAARSEFAAFCQAQGERWEAEAKAGLALIKSLSN